MTEDTDMTAPLTVKITVFMPGTHAGKRYTPGPDGLVLEVSPQAADFLRARGDTRRPVPASAPCVPDVDANATPASAPAARPTRRVGPKD